MTNTFEANLPETLLPTGESLYVEDVQLMSTLSEGCVTSILEMPF